MIIGTLRYNKAEDVGEVLFHKEFERFDYVFKLDILSDISYDIDQKAEEVRSSFKHLKEHIA